MSTNNGLSTANFLSGAMQGYQFMQGVEDRKQIAGLRDADAARNEEQFQMQKQQHEQSNQLHAARMRQLSNEEQEKAQQIFARQLYAIDSGTDLSPEEKNDLVRATGGSRMLDPMYLASPELGEALEVYPQLMSGELNQNDPRAIRAANTLFNVQRGATDGRQVSINRIVPSKDGQGIHLGLHVRNADGTENPNAVLTDGRSSDPNDPVSVIPLDEVNGVYEATKNLRTLVMDPKYRKMLYRQYGLGAQQVSPKDQSVIDKNNAQTALYKYKSDNEKNGGSGGKNGGDTATKKDIEYFQSLGYSKEDSVDMVVNRGASPSQEIFSMAKIIIESSKADGGPASVTLKDAINQASEVYKEKFQRSPTNSAKPPPENGGTIVHQLMGGQSQTPSTQIPMRSKTQAPEAAIKFLKSNPDQAENFKAKYGYLPE